MNELKIKLSSDKEWRDFYEAKCREQRKEIAALREGCQHALEVFTGIRYEAGVPQKLAKLIEGKEQACMDAMTRPPGAG